MSCTWHHRPPPLPHKENIPYWEWLFSIIAWINPQCVANVMVVVVFTGAGPAVVAKLSLLIWYNPAVVWNYVVNITYWCCLDKRKLSNKPEEETPLEKSVQWRCVTLSRLENPQTHCFWTQWTFWTKSLGPSESQHSSAAVINGEPGGLFLVLSSHCTLYSPSHCHQSSTTKLFQSIPLASIYSYYNKSHKIRYQALAIIHYWLISTSH